MTGAAPAAAKSKFSKYFTNGREIFMTISADALRLGLAAVILCSLFLTLRTALGLSMASVTVQRRSASTQLGKTLLPENATRAQRLKYCNARLLR
jgi:hypothetical protein